MYSDNIKFGEKPDDIYYHIEQLEGDIQEYKEIVNGLFKEKQFLQSSVHWLMTMKFSRFTDIRNVNEFGELEDE